MPLVNSTSQTLEINAEYLMNYQKQWDGIKAHPLGANIGTRVIQEIGEEWYVVKLEISWFERENLSAKTQNVRISGRMASRLAANGGTMSDEDEFSIPVEEADAVAMKKLKYMETYLVGWCHTTGKPSTSDLKRLTPLTAWAIQEIIMEINKGQVLLPDSPLPES